MLVLRRLEGEQERQAEWRRSTLHLPGGGCGKTFTDTGKLHGHRFTADQIGAAIRQFYAGTSYKQIAEDMEERYDIPEPSKAAIYYWVRDFTDAALERMGEFPAETSGEWGAAREYSIPTPRQLASSDLPYLRSHLPRIAREGLGRRP